MGISPALPRKAGQLMGNKTKELLTNKIVCMKKLRQASLAIKKLYKTFTLASACLLLQIAVNAQDGNAGIQEANTRVRSYFDSGTNLMYAIGAILGLIGAVKVYQKWNAGDHDTGKVAAAWFGSCVFLVVVATVIRSFFGI
jgi:hypothetical protein